MITLKTNDGTLLMSTDLFARVVSDPKRGDTVGDYKVSGRQGNHVNYIVGQQSHNVSLAVWSAIARNQIANH